MKRIATKRLGWSLLILALAIFLLARPVRKVDYAAMTEDAIADYTAHNPGVAGDRDFKRIAAGADRLIWWSRGVEGRLSELRLFTSGVLFLAGLLTIHIGSWVPPESSKDTASPKRVVGSD